MESIQIPLYLTDIPLHLLANATVIPLEYACYFSGIPMEFQMNL